jgi:hypothetical protein
VPGADQVRRPLLGLQPIGQCGRISRGEPRQFGHRRADPRAPCPWWSARRLRLALLASLLLPVPLLAHGSERKSSAGRHRGRSPQRACSSRCALEAFEPRSQLHRVGAILRPARQRDRRPMESLKAGLEHRSVGLVEQPASDVHDPVGVDPKDVAVEREMVNGAESEAVDDGGDALGLDVGERWAPPAPAGARADRPVAATCYGCVASTTPIGSCSAHGLTRAVLRTSPTAASVSRQG